MPKKNKKKQANSKKSAINKAEEIKKVEPTEETENSNVEEVSTTSVQKVDNNAKTSETKSEKKADKKAEKKAKKQAKNADKKHRVREFNAELKKITWPTKHELLENTVVVISMVVIVSLIIFLLDLGFKALSNAEIKGVDKIKNSIEASNVSASNDTENTSSNDVENESSNEVDTNSTSENAQ